MAEILSNSKRKSSPRIDFTPMVDLGFLLITFFIFTTTLSETRTIDVQMPMEGGSPTEIAEHTAMTLFLSKNHEVLYLKGTDAMNSNFEKLTKVSFKALRNALLTHKSEVKQAYQNHLVGSKPNDQPFLLIKASDDSQYEDLVNVLDELTIDDMKNYALLDLSEAEILAIKNHS
jgi:biopolymer transport protein ExbD